MALVPAHPAAEVLVGDESAVCTPQHCFHAFDALYCALTDSAPIPPQFPDDKYPLFVTWNTRSSRPGRAPRLRGCIGNFEPLPLHEGLAEYALVSAFRDHRFRKIERRELDSLECAVSLLTDFEDAASYLDWTVGVHGIRIAFSHPSTLPSSDAPSPLSSSASLLSSSNSSTARTSARPSPSFSATYLPEIAPEQGWDKIDAIDSAIQKAGWRGPVTEDLRRSLHVRRYQSRKCTVEWDEYVEWRRLNGGEI